MFNPLKVHVEESVAYLAVEMVVIRIKVRVVAYCSESSDCPQEFGPHQFRQRIINSGSRQLG